MPREATMRHVRWALTSPLLVTFLLCCIIHIADSDTAIPQLPDRPGTSEGRLACGKYACCLVVGGRIYCWGSDWKAANGGFASQMYGRSSTYPITSLNYLSFSDTVEAHSVAMSNYVACALFVNGKIRCWGEITSGQAGTDSIVTDPVGLTLLPYIPFSQTEPAIGVDCGKDHVCALFQGGGIICWGRNFYGNMGIDAAGPIGLVGAFDFSQLEPLQFSTTHPAVKLSTGYDHSCAIFDTPKRDIRCWGQNSVGASGVSGASNVGKTSSGYPTSSIPFIAFNTNATVKDLFTPPAQTCVTFDDGTARCIGSNYYGQAGIDSTTTYGMNPTSSEVPPIAFHGAEIVNIGGGAWHNCAVFGNGTHRCFGYARFGSGLHDDGLAYRGHSAAVPVMGVPDTPHRYTEKIVATDGGVLHSCVLFETNRVICAGYNYYGIAGMDNTVTYGGGYANKISELTFIQFSNPFLLKADPSSLPLVDVPQSVDLRCNPYIPVAEAMDVMSVRLTHNGTKTVILPASYENDPRFYRTVVPAFNQTGNVSLALSVDDIPYQNDVNVYIYTQPTITSVSPLSGPVEGGTNVVVQGSDLISDPLLDPKCCFSSSMHTSAIVMSTATYNVSDGAYICTSPALNVTQFGSSFANVSVALNGRDCSQTSMPFYVYENSKITWPAITPQLGLVTGGTNVTVDAVDLPTFTDPVHVWLGDHVSVSAMITRTGSNVRLALTTFDVSSHPSVVPGAEVEVSVSVNTQQRIPTPHMWKFYAAPSLLAVSPGAAPISGGAALTLQGDGFFSSPSITVRLTDSQGGIHYTSGLFVNIVKYVTFTVPAVASGITDVAVSFNSQQYPGQQRPLSSFDITALVPAGGPISGNTRVTVVGSAFVFSGPTLRCRFGTTLIAASFVSSTAILCVSPATALSTVQVDVSVFTDFTTRLLPYSFFEYPSFSSMSPLSAPTTAATSKLTITGTGFVTVSPGPKCAFGATEVSGTFETPDTLVCPIPSGAGNAFIKASMNSKDFDDTGFVFSYFKVTSIAPKGGPQTGGTEVALQGSGFTDGMTCRFGTIHRPAFRQGPGSVLCVAPSTPTVGNVELALSGNADEFASGLDYTYYGDPVVTLVRPETGPENGGTKVTVAGTNFTTAMSSETVYCRFGDQRVVGSFTSTGNITCTSPPASGSSLLTVSFNSGADFSKSLASFYYFEIATLEPKIGPSTGGTRVTITGGVWPKSQFRIPGVVRCQFSHPSDTSVDPVLVDAEYISSNKLSCMTPAAHQSQTITDIKVTTNGLAFSPSSVRFTYYENPIVSSLSPTIGTSRGGTYVTIIGSNFRNDTGAALSCKFQLKVSPQAFMYSQSKVVCVSPPGGGRLDVAISLNDVNFVPAGSFQFASVLSIRPQWGPTSGGTQLTVKGSGFADSGRVLSRVGTVVSPATYVSEASAIAVSPPAPALRKLGVYSTVGVEMSFNGVDYSSPNNTEVQFTYYTPPQLSSISPSGGPTIGGTPVTVKGSGFLSNGLMACKFGDDGHTGFVTAQVLSSDTLVCNASVHSVGTIYLLLSGNGQEFHSNNGRAEAAFTFTECPKGTFSKVHTDPCTPCPPGQFGPESGLRECQLCGTQGYSTEPGSTICLPCPSNTTIVDDVSDSLAKCVCEPGSYRPDGKTGLACEACPLGAVCDGGTEPARAQAGFWSSQESPFIFVECDRASSCPGGPISECANGYGGRLCADCLPGYFQAGDSCDPCPPQNGQAELLFIGFFIFCYIVAIGLLRVVDEDSSNSAGGMITIFTTSFQVLAMIAGMSLHWPAIIVRTINIATLPFTLNLDLFASECSLPGFTFKHKWVAKTAIPYVFALVLLSLYLVAWIHKKILRAETWSDQKKADRALLTGWRQFLLTPTDMTNYWNRIINSLAMMFTLVFLMVVVNALVIFDCTQRADGKWTLDAQPSLLCFEPWWYQLMPIGAAALALYGLFVPLGLGWWVHRNRHRLTDPDFASRWGSVFANFKEEYPYFETVIMFEKFALATCMLFFTTYPMFQLISVLTVLLVTLLIQIFVQPYASTDDNEVGMAMGWALCLVLIIGALIHSGEVPFYGVVDALIVLFFIVFGFCCLLLLGVFAHGGRKTVRLLRTNRETSEIRRLIRSLCFPHGRKHVETWVKEASLMHFDRSNFERAWLAIGMYDQRHPGLRTPLTSRPSSHILTEEEEKDKAAEFALDQFTGHIFAPSVLPMLRKWFFTRCAASRKPRSHHGRLARKDLFAFYTSFGQFAQWRLRRANRMKSSFVTRVLQTLFPKKHALTANKVQYAPFDAVKNESTLATCALLVRAMYHVDGPTADSLATDICMKINAPGRQHGAQTLDLAIHILHRAWMTRPELNADTTLDVVRANVEQIVQTFGHVPTDGLSDGGSSYYGYEYETQSE